MAHKWLRRSILLPVVLLSVIGVAVGQTVWTSSIGYTILPGASMVWVQSMNVGNLDEGGTASVPLSNVVSIYLTKSQSYTVVLSITNVSALQAHFSTLTLTFKEGTSTVTVISLTNPSTQFTLGGPQTMVLNVVVAYAVQSSVTNGQSITGTIGISAAFG